MRHDRVMEMQERRDHAVRMLEGCFTAVVMVSVEDVEWEEAWRERANEMLVWSREVRERLDALINRELSGG